MTGGWGKAGVRLTEREHRQRQLERLAVRAAIAASHRNDDEIAETKWRHGLMVPANITHALNLLHLYGPEVDRALGVEEPTVDLWEEGKIYPTWEQVLALAALTQRSLLFFFTDWHWINVIDTSQRYHLPASELDAPGRILRFEPEAIRAVVGQQGGQDG